MKRNLGKLFVLCITILTLQAGDFDYHIHVDKQMPYVKEAVLLTVDVNQTNHNVVLLFDFDLVKNDTYSFQRVDIKEIDAYHDVQIRYTYLVYPLKAGKVPIYFSLTQKATTDDSIAYSFSGDRDNVKTLETRNTKIDVSPLILQVKALPEGTQIIGDFSLDYKVKTHDAKAFEPLPLQITLKGLGYPPLLKSLLPEEGNFTRFTETPILKTTVTKNATHSTVTYPMALSHDNSFTLNSLDIKAFNPKTATRYTLTMPPQHFNITRVKKSTLIDTVNTPEFFEVDWTWIQALFTYLITFFAGVLTALFWKEKKKNVHKDKHPIIHKIQNAKTAKALLQVLLSNNPQRFTETIQHIEASLDTGTPLNLNNIKKNALEKVR